MEKIIHFTVPEKISEAQLEIIDCARKLHPTWEIKVWQDPIQANGYLLEHYWPKANSGAQLADLLRLDILYKFGGVYVDSDLKLFRPLDGLIENFDFFLASEDGYRITNALIGARKGNPALRRLIDDLRDREPDWTLTPNITTGPEYFSQQLKWRREVTLLPRETFYPYNWSHVGEKRIHRHSLGEHLWIGSWKSGSSGDAEAIREKPDKRAQSGVVKRIKLFAKTCIAQIFRQWHRLRSIDPNKPRPHINFYQCSGELVVQTIHGIKIVVDGRDVSITPDLVFNGYYELPEENFVKNFVKGGDWVIDVGANVGSFSLLAAQRVGPFGRVFSFEPNPRPAELMAKSLVMNWMHERVIQRPVAAAAKSTMASLTFDPDCLGGAQVGQDDVHRSTGDKNLEVLGERRKVTLQIPCVSLDEEFAVDLPIKVLKIDVEGNEGQVLAGADRLLQRRCIDVVILELLEEVAGARWGEVLDQVNKVIGYGYQVCTLTNAGETVEQADLATAIRVGARNIALVAREQYKIRQDNE